MNIVVLCGGVGAARFLLGLRSLKYLHPQIKIEAIVNTGDDDTFYGQYVCPDIDTILYHLSGLHDEQRGWGRKNDTFNFVQTLKELGEESWFNLGDKDLALNKIRTELRSQKVDLSTITSHLCRKLVIDDVKVMPMSNEKVSTKIITDKNEKLSMQEYFVRERCKPVIKDIQYESEKLIANPIALYSLANADKIIIAPSNPFLSILPILAIEVIANIIHDKKEITTAVSPLIGNHAVKGPLALNMESLGHDVSSVGIAKIYREFINTLVIDESDFELETQINELGIKTQLCPTLMDSEKNRLNLAACVAGLEK